MYSPSVEQSIDYKELRISDGFKDGFYPVEFRMHILYRHIFPGGGFTPSEKLILMNVFCKVSEIVVRARICCDGIMTELGVHSSYYDMYLDAGTVSAIRSMYRLLTGQDEQIATLVDLRDPQYPGAELIIPPYIVGTYRIIVADGMAEGDIIEAYSREAFINNGGICHAVYLTGDLFSVITSEDSRAIILFTALVNAICSNYSSSIYLFKKILLLFPSWIISPDDEDEFFGNC